VYPGHGEPGGLEPIDWTVSYLREMREACARRGWELLAAHVRSDHVNTVVRSHDSAEEVMLAFKSYASRALNNGGIDPVERKRWTRHGSTRHLWTPDQVRRAILYVISGQGETLEVFFRESGAAR
jgi:REP element-mobilizing transposase RayT